MRIKFITAISNESLLTKCWKLLLQKVFQFLKWVFNPNWRFHSANITLFYLYWEKFPNQFALKYQVKQMHLAEWEIPRARHKLPGFCFLFLYLPGFKLLTSVMSSVIEFLKLIGISENKFPFVSYLLPFNFISTLCFLYYKKG